MTDIRLQTKRAISRPVKTVIWILIGLVILLVSCYCGIAGYVGWQLTHPERLAITDSPKNYGLAFEDIEFKSRTDHLPLKGWYIPAAHPNSSNLTLIFAHGYRQNRVQPDVHALSLAKSLSEAGYSIVMFDFRNSGESGGNLTSVGQFEKRDLLGAIDWVEANHPGKVGLIGFSMGATTSLLAAAENPNVVGVIADSPFNQLQPYLEENLSKWSDLPDFPFTPLILSIIPPLTGVQPSKVDALSAVDQVYPRPVLFIHSVDDEDIPYQNSESMYEKHKDKFEMWASTKAGHAKTYRTYPDEYVNRVLTFIQKW